MSLLEFAPNLSSSTLKYIISDIQKLTTTIANDTVYVFTDGNCKRNGKTNAKGGYSVYFGDENETRFCVYNKTEIVKEPTNQKCELTAIYEVFKTVSQNTSQFIDKKIVVCTDSMYSINCLTRWYKSWQGNNWKTSKGETVKNKDIITSIVSLKETLEMDNIKVDFKHVNSHTIEPPIRSPLHFFWKGNKHVDDSINRMLE